MLSGQSLSRLGNPAVYQPKIRARKTNSTEINGNQIIGENVLNENIINGNGNGNCDNNNLTNGCHHHNNKENCNRHTNSSTVNSSLTNNTEITPISTTTTNGATTTTTTPTSTSIVNGTATTSSSENGDEQESLVNFQKIIFDDLISKANTNGRIMDMEKLFQMMRSERSRLLSFTDNGIKQWPKNEIDVRDLAKAGFFYLCKDDRTRCAFCRGIIEQWEPNDDPLLEHMRHFPTCSFMLDYNVGNIPLNGVNPVKGYANKFGRDTCGNHELPRLQINGSVTSASSSPSSPSSPLSSPVSSMSTTPSPSPSENITVNPIHHIPLKNHTNQNLSELGVRPHHGARNPNYISVDKRLQSFDATWNSRCKVSPKKLAEAGFYHVGIGDYVKCFYCDGGLYEWESTDDPWTEHAYWFSDCDFVILNKGASFVQSCLDSDGKRRLRHRLMSNTLNDDEKAIKAVDEWMKSDLIVDLKKVQKYDDDLIKAALHRRWIDRQEPFEHIGDLIAAIVELKSIPSLLSFSMSDDEDEESRLKSVNENNATTGHSRTESLSSTSTSPSPPSSTKEERLWCKICLDKEVGVLFLPCGHVVACTQCAPGLADCPICRESIKGIVRTFFS